LSRARVADEGGPISELQFEPRSLRDTKSADPARSVRRRANLRREGAEQSCDASRRRPSVGAALAKTMKNVVTHGIDPGRVDIGVEFPVNGGVEARRQFEGAIVL
jgi:hypothetical protein